MTTGYTVILQSKKPLTDTTKLDFWYYEMGANIIPFDTINGRPILTEWKPFQDKPVDEVLYKYWKKNNMFSSGARVILGRVWRKKGLVGSDKDLQYWLGCIDCDSPDAINNLGLLENLKKQFYIEEHKNTPGKYHIFFLTTKPIQSNRLIVDNGKCIFEIFGGDNNHLMNVSPSFHRDGSPYTEVDWCTTTPFIDRDGESITKWLTSIFDKYKQSYKYDSKGLLGITTKADISRIGKSKIAKGNRHNDFMSLINSVIGRNKAVLTKEQIKKMVLELNLTECE
jgi:hypothetical protein